MAVDAVRALYEVFLKSSPCPAAPQPKLHPQLHQATHASITVFNDASESDNFIVNVFDASKNINIQLNLSSKDTTDTLIKKYLQQRPEMMMGKLNLAFNGKPVPEQKTMGELGVKAGAMFITFQRCAGG